MRTFVLAASLTVALLVSTAAADEPWRRHAIDHRGRGADGVRLADINGDGRLDIVTAWEEEGEVRLYLHPGPAGVRQPWPAVTVGRVRAPEDAVLVDLDGDGRLEIVSSCEGAERTMYVHWGPRDDARLLDPTAWTTEPIAATAGREMWMFATPVRRAGGGYDLVCGSKGAGASVSILRRPANPRRLDDWRLERIVDAGWIMSLIAVDFDGDGDDDVIVSDRRGPRSGVWWFEQSAADSAGESTWRSHAIHRLAQQAMFAAYDDLTGDGRPEVLLAAKEHQVLWFARDERTPNAWTMGRHEYDAARFGHAKAVRAGDLTGDGRAELVVSCEGASGGRAGLFLLAGGGEQWRAIDVAGPRGVKYDLIELIDLDGDGDLDILTCEESEGLGVVWYENPTIGGR